MGGIYYNGVKFSETGSSGESMIAEEYRTTASYSTNDYCTHNGKLYRCTAAATGSFDSSKWSEEFVTDQLTAFLNTPLADNTGY